MADAVALRQLAAQEASVPEHLRGVPDCLHKYEPVLRAAWEADAKAPPARADAA
jgi:hypothetical protein